MSELKPCPDLWCASSPCIVSIDANHYYPVCSICRIQPPTVYSTREEAVFAWNTRPPTMIEKAAEEMAIQLRGVLDWAGKDKRKLTRRGWTLDKEMASLNNACAALLHYQQAKEGK